MLENLIIIFPTIFYIFYYKSNIIDLSESSIIILLSYSLAGTIMISALFSIPYCIIIYSPHLVGRYRFFIAISVIIILLLDLFSDLIKVPESIEYLIHYAKFDRDQEIVDAIYQLCRKMGLKKAPSVIFSPNKNFAPQAVACYFRKKTFIIFPKNFREYVTEFTEAKLGIREKQKSELYHNALRDFIVFHELSHIKNGDAYHNTIINSLLENSLIWGILSILAFGYAYVHHAQEYGVSPLILLASLVLLYLVTSAFKRIRELLADSTAMLYLSYAKSELLTHPVSSFPCMPVLEAFLNYLNNLPPVGTLLTRTSWKKRLSDYINRLGKSLSRGKLNLFQEYPYYPERIQALKRQTYLSNRIPYPSIESINYLGILHVIVCLISLDLAHGLRIMPFFPFCRGFINSALFVLAFGIPLNLCVITFTIPLKNAVSSINDFGHSIQFRENFFKLLSNIMHFLCMIGCSFLVLGLMSKTIISSLSTGKWKAYLYLIFLDLFYNTFGIILLICIVVFFHRDIFYIKKHRKLLPLALFLLVSPLLMLVFFIDITKINFLLFLVSFVLAYQFNSFILQNKKRSISLENRYYIINIFNKDIFFESKRDSFLDNLKLTLLFYLVELMIPSLESILIYLCLKSILIPYTPEISRELLSSSNDLILLGLVIFLIFSIILLTKPKMKYTLLNPAISYYPIFELARLLNFTIEPYFYCKIAEKIDCFYQKDNGFRIRNGLYSNDLHGTFCSVRIIISGIDHAKKEDLFNYVMSLYSEKGGFSFHKGYEPRLKQTYYACEILKDLDMLHKADKQGIVNWVLSLQNQEQGYFTTPFFGMPCIEETFYAVQILKLLGYPAPCPGKLESWLAEKWRGNLGIENSFYMVKCLSPLKEELGREIINKCLRANYNRFNNMRYDKDNRQIFMCLYIAMHCYGMDSTEFKLLSRNSGDEIVKVLSLI